MRGVCTKDMYYSSVKVGKSAQPIASISTSMRVTGCRFNRRLSFQLNFHLSFQSKMLSKIFMKLVVDAFLLFKLELKWKFYWKLKRLFNRRPGHRPVLG